MEMLDRIKRKQEAGFKEFVLNIETTGATKRAQIFTSGVLEDPIFMGWALKNIRTFNDFLELSSDDIDTVLKNQDQMMPVIAKCVFGATPEEMLKVEGVLNRYTSRLRDEISYLKDVTPAEKESSKFFLLKTTRKLQMEERIIGFPWKMPPRDIFFPKSFKDGDVQIKYENGTVAAEGKIEKGKREGAWNHYYENGSKLADGEYRLGLKHNYWHFYYSNGKVKSEGRYREDLKHGIWKELDRNDAVTESEYVEGVKK